MPSARASVAWTMRGDEAVGVTSAVGAAADANANRERYIENEDFAPFGVRAHISTRGAGDLALNGDAPVGEVLLRWEALRQAAGAGGPGSRFATAKQVHGTRVLQHGPGWAGWLRADEGDGHFADEPGTGLGVTVADCVPVFLAHPSGAVGLVHAGWRGTAAGILRVALAVFREHGMSPVDVHVHLGPAICGHCYEVGADVYTELTGSQPGASRTVDLRALLARQAESAGVRRVATSPSLHSVRQRALLLPPRGGFRSPGSRDRVTGRAVENRLRLGVRACGRHRGPVAVRSGWPSDLSPDPKPQTPDPLVFCSPCLTFERQGAKFIALGTLGVPG